MQRERERKGNEKDDVSVEVFEKSWWLAEMLWDYPDVKGWQVDVPLLLTGGGEQPAAGPR